MAIEKLKNLPVIGRAFFSSWMKKINEIIDGVNDTGDIVDDKLEPIENELDPEVEGSLANTVGGIVEEIGDNETEGTILGEITAIQTEIGTDETADSILGRINTLENDTYVVMTKAEREEIFTVNSPFHTVNENCYINKTKTKASIRVHANNVTLDATTKMLGQIRKGFIYNIFLESEMGNEYYAWYNWSSRNSIIVAMFDRTEPHTYNNLGAVILIDLTSNVI